MLIFDIRVYSHSFFVHLNYANGREALLEYCQSMTVYEMVWVPAQRRKIRKPKYIFATATADRKTFGFLLADLNNLLNHLRSRGFSSDEWSIEHMPVSEGVPIEIEVAKGIGPRDDEQRAVMAFNTEDRKTRVMPLRTGGGKSLSLDAPVLTIDGYKPMGDIKVGDALRAIDGSTTYVKAVHPQPVRPLYRVKVKGGQSVLCDWEHLWFAWAEDQIRPQVITTADMMELGDIGLSVQLPVWSEDNVLEYHFVESIEYERDDLAQCIEVDHPTHLFITDGGLVTHNTATGLMTVAHWKRRTACIMSAGYIKNWIKSTKWVLDIDQRDITILQGRKKLVTAVELAQEGLLTYKLIFITINTLRDFIKDYMIEGYTINGVGPLELMEVLGVGFVINDESHESIHAMVRGSIYSNVRRRLYLSATIVSDNPMLNQQYEKIFPLSERFMDGRKNDHCIGYWFTYDIANGDKVKYMGSRGYSHSAFEQAMRKDPKRFKLWCDMHADAIEEHFFADYEPGQKCLVFCSEVDTCEAMAAHLKATFKGRKVTITSYTAKEDEEILYTHDIVVSTPGSAGTGKDIPNLKTGVTAVNIDSTQKNLQMIGRFRDMKDWPDLHPRFVFMSARCIDKQMEYGARKMEYLEPHSHKLVRVDSTYVV